MKKKNALLVIQNYAATIKKIASDLSKIGTDCLGF